MKRRARVILPLTLVLAVCVGILVQPNAAANWSGTVSFYPGTVYVGEFSSVTFTFTSTGTQGSTNIQDFKVSYDWMASGTWDDLGSKNAIPDGGTATFTDQFTVPNSVGAHTMTISITAQATGDWLSSTSTYSGTLSIANRPPLAVAIQANPSTGTAPSTVYFTSTVSGGTPGYSYSWSFGDGGTDITANPSHTYTSAGTYTVSLVVTDAMGRIQSDTVSVTITAASTGGGTGGGSSGSNPPPSGGLDATTLILIGVLAAVAILVAAIVIARGRRKQSPPMSPQRPPTTPPP